MIDMRYKPYYLPQMNAPYSIVLQKLDDENILYDMIEIDPENLNVSQGIAFSDDVANAKLDDLNPIYIDSDMNVLDGHHRMVRALLDKVPLKAIKIDMTGKDACRILNKIQDIYEYEQSGNIEEVEMQDAINDENGMKTNYSDRSEFLSSLEEDNIAVQTEMPGKNEQSVIAYRKGPIKENSVVGNFFTLKPIDGFDKYQIDFDNLLDTNALGIVYKDSQQPAEILAKIWFPNVNFEQLSQQYNMPPVNLKNKAIAEKAMSLNYDGIKYGNTLIQGLK